MTPCAWNDVRVSENRVLLSESRRQARRTCGNGMHRAAAAHQGDGDGQGREGFPRDGQEHEGRHQTGNDGQVRRIDGHHVESRGSAHLRGRC